MLLKDNFLTDHVESCHFTKFTAFRVNRDQIMDLDTWFQIHTNVPNVETAWCQVIDWLNFESRSSSLRNFGLVYRMTTTKDILD